MTIMLWNYLKLGQFYWKSRGEGERVKGGEEIMCIILLKMSFLQCHMSFVYKTQTLLLTRI